MEEHRGKLCTETHYGYIWNLRYSWFDWEMLATVTGWNHFGKVNAKPTFSSIFFLSSLDLFAICLRNSLSCSSLFCTAASFCSSSSFSEWATDLSANWACRTVLSYWDCFKEEKNTKKCCYVIVCPNISSNAKAKQWLLSLTIKSRIPFSAIISNQSVFKQCNKHFKL